MKSILQHIITYLCFSDEMLEEVEQVKRMVTSLHNNTQDLESQVQILESKIGGKITGWNIVLWKKCSDLNKST